MVDAQTLPGAELGNQISFNLEGSRFRLRASRRIAAAMLQGLVLLPLLLDLGLGITACANQILLGIVQSVLQQRNPCLGYLQSLLDGVEVVLAWIGREFGEQAGLLLHGLKPTFEEAYSSIELLGLAVFDRRTLLRLLQGRSESEVHFVIANVHGLRPGLLFFSRARHIGELLRRLQRALIYELGLRRLGFPGVLLEQVGSRGLSGQRKSDQRRDQQRRQARESEFPCSYVHTGGPVLAVSQ